MINMPLFKFLLAALSVLSCVGAVAPSTTLDVAVASARLQGAKVRRCCFRNCGCGAVDRIRTAV